MGMTEHKMETTIYGLGFIFLSVPHFTRHVLLYKVYGTSGKGRG